MSDSLKIIFFGTPGFAVASLEQITMSKHEVVAVVTAVDKEAGRGRQVRESAVKQYASSKELDILQPENLKSTNCLEQLGNYKADLFVVVAFRKLPVEVWSMPLKGTFNLHASLLPDYRGAAPINWAIINGDKETGVTTFYINEQIDAGNIIFNEKVEIPEEDNAGSLHDKLMDIGGRLVVKTIDAIERNDVNPLQQEINSSIRSAPKIFKSDCELDWSADARTIFNKVRGLSPYPAAHAQLVSPNNEIHVVKIFNCKISEGANNGSKGAVITDGKT
ncbi:MAG: methionyl-tRNA formyltransferase, partial [Bacteroidetes bacterium]|nr:methionyl-tRNA formyltransferase [Bacteroidota bacterium]